VGENLSNWYVRLNRKRFWGGEYNDDKLAAYQTLYTCLDTVARLMAPIAPFFAEQLFLDLNAATGKDNSPSVHLTLFPEYQESVIDTNLETCMELAQLISSMILAIRKKADKKVRQPLSKAVVPAIDETTYQQIKYVASLIQSEVNIKELEIIPPGTEMDNVVKKVKPNFKTLGKKYGKLMKELAVAIGAFSKDQIRMLENDGHYRMQMGGENVEILAEDVEIITEDMPGWMVANDGKITVALDITVTDALQNEGIARELVNRIQNLRKSAGFAITDRIRVEIQPSEEINAAIGEHSNYICLQTLCDKISLTELSSNYESLDFDDFEVRVRIQKV
jgi:isoleucyl-tRNA synthetase